MRYENRLTPLSLQALHKLTFFAQTLTVYNTSPYAVLVRRGSSLPDALSYDYIIPAGTYKTLPVSGYEFGLKIDVTGDPGQFLPVLYTFAADEPVPSFSLAHYRESQEFISQTDNAIYFIDARGAVGLYLELSWSTDFVFVSGSGWSSALCHIHAGSHPEFVPSKETLITVQPLVDSHVNAKIGLPVTNPYYKIIIERKTTTPFPIRVRYQLSDAFAGLSRQPIAVTHSRSFSSAAWSYNSLVTFTSDALVGSLDHLYLAIETNQPNFRYELAVSVAAEQGATISRVIKYVVIASELSTSDLTVIDTADFLVAYRASPRLYYYHVPLQIPVSGFFTVTGKRTTYDTLVQAFYRLQASLEIQR